MEKENTMAKVVNTLLKGKILDNDTVRDFSNLGIAQILSGIDHYNAECAKCSHLIDQNEYRIGLALQGKLSDERSGGERKYTGAEGIYTTLNHIVSFNPIPTNALLNAIDLFKRNKHIFLFCIIEYFKPGCLLSSTVEDISHLKAVSAINKEKIKLRSYGLLDMTTEEQIDMYDRLKAGFMNDESIKTTYDLGYVKKAS